MLIKKINIQFVLLVYNLASSSLYFISAIFFLQHIGYEKYSPLSDYSSLTNKVVLLIAAAGCVLMFFSQQFNLYKKATNQLQKNNFHWISDLGIYYRSIVMSTSFFALINGFISIYISIPTSIIAAFGAAELNRVIILNSKPSPLIISKFYCFYVSISYATSLSALYFNTMQHILLIILKQSQLLKEQLLLIMPFSFFTFFFLVGMTLYSLDILNPDIFTKNKFPTFIRTLMPLFASNCVMWKSIVNTMSLVSLTYLLFIRFNQIFYLFISIALFTIIYLSQTIFLSKWTAASS